MDRFPDMIGRPPEYSGGRRESGWGNIPFHRRESKFQVSILCKRVRGLKKGSACIHDLGPGPHGVHGPGGRPGGRPGECPEPRARLQIELRSRADRPCGRGKRPIDKTTDRPE